MKSYLEIFKNGLWKENAVFVLALGLCPALAVTTSASDGFGMGIALIFVLSMSVLILSLCRNFISDKVRVPFFMAVIAGFTTITDMSMKAYLPALAKSLGLYVPLIVVNCIPLGRTEVYATKNGPMQSLIDGLGMGAGFTIALTVIGGIRELLGNGTLFKIPVLAAIPSFKPAVMMIMPAGGFIVMGILMGIYAWYNKRASNSGVAEAFGLQDEELVPPEIPDEITHASVAEKN
ncbi:MAG: electron transport complex subunit E [Firmicutes bacterium]|nr:electron transport complex subunit E [Bacillota bacterium]